jgi:hypothetical protein
VAKDGQYAQCYDITAETDGSFLFDLALWEYGPGWYDGRARKVNSYEVIDEATGNQTTSEAVSDWGNFRIKVPTKKPPKIKIIP